MKKYAFFLVFQFCLLASAQTKLTFGYDAAGNQTSRVLCVNCLSKHDDLAIDADAITEEDPDKFFEEDVISYYPNPVKEELYLQWQLVQDNYVTSIQVYSMTGQLLRVFQADKETHNLNIPFQLYPSGIYLVLLSYKNGDDKSIKIIKL